MLALGFLNPLLLWALPLAAVPIIIHLLNKRRFQTVRWAAMEFLLRAMKRNRRRLRMEHFIVLLLRTLAVLFLVFLVTRPQLTGGGLLGVRTHHVVLLDDSASMAQRAGTTNVYEQARDQIRTLATNFVDTRSGDLFTLVRASKAGAPDIAKQRVGPTLPRLVGEALSTHAVGDEVMDLAELLEAARRLAEATEEAGRTDYYLFTDFRHRDWLAGDDTARTEVAAQLEAMDQESEHLVVQPLGSADSTNLAIVDVRRVNRLAVAGVRVTIAIDVVNRGLDTSNPVELAVTVDQTSNVTQTVPELAPGQRISLEIDHTFHAPGHHGIVATLPTDKFPVDDSRSLALEVIDRSRVLIVDGDPGDDPERAESYYIAAALDPGGDAVSGIEVRVVDVDNFGDVVFDEYGLVVLANVAAPDAEIVTRLERYVAAGGGLLVFLGNQVEIDRYNELLFKDGQGLIPARVLDVEGDMDRPERFFLAAPDHPAFAIAPEFFELVFSVQALVFRYMPLEVDPRFPATVLMRLNDAEGAPLGVTRPFGDGGIVGLFGFTADNHWCYWPETSGFLPFVVETHHYAVKEHDLSRMNHSSSGSLSLDLDLGLYRPDVAVQAMSGDGEARTFTAVRDEVIDREETPDGNEPPAKTQEGQEADAADVGTVLVPMNELRGLGLFEAVLTSHGETTESLVFSRNPPPDEGRLQRMTRGLFGEKYPSEVADRVTFLDADSGGVASRAGEGELWRWLAAALLAGLLLESVLAWRFGRR